MLMKDIIFKRAKNGVKCAFILSHCKTSGSGAFTSRLVRALGEYFPERIYFIFPNSYNIGLIKKQINRSTTEVRKIFSPKFEVKVLVSEDAEATIKYLLEK